MNSKFDSFSEKSSKEKSKPKVVEQSFIKPIRKKKIKFLFIQMEYCEGKTLKEICSESDINYAPEIKRLFAQMVSALNYMHTKNLIHRDLKPANVFLDRNNNIKLGDFGLARNFKGFKESPDSATVPTEEGDLQMSQNIGTPFYMAPEQRNSGRYDSRVDMYSLGLILLELLMPKFNTKMERFKVHPIIVSVSGISEIRENCTLCLRTSRTTSWSP